MAAYSAVACFRQTLQQLLDSDDFADDFPKFEIQSLHENVRSLQSSLDRIPFVPKKWRKTMNELQTRIRDAIYAAQDKVDYSISKVHSSERSDEISLKKIVDDVDLVEKEAAKTAEAISNEPLTQNSFPENPQPSKFKFSGKDTIVGQKKDKIRVIEELISNNRQRLVVPIMGLPGLGKTTLARNIYDNQAVVAQFNIRAWVTVSQEYSFQEIFSNILRSMESKNYKAGHYARHGDEQTLLSHLYQELYNLKYLIVVDDVWDPEVWDILIQALPDKENGSRVLLTTRIQTVATSVQKYGYVHTMKPLSLDKSWKLLCYKVFEEEEEALPPRKKDITEACPPHLRVIGLSIAEKCKGLPLSLAVVGGLLVQEREKIEYWKIIEEDVNSAASVGEKYYEEVLSLSYNHLPGKLRACFLYMGAFPEDSEIPVSKLIKLWVAEGFLTLTQESSPEVVARRWLDDLIGRNLISIRRKSSNGGIKFCGLHDSLRELAENESRKEKFFHSRKRYAQKQEEDMQIQRRVSIHRNILMCLEDVYSSTQSIKDARSLLYVGAHHHHPLSFSLTFDLLRVLDAFTVYFIDFPHEFLKLIHLRYLSLTYNDDIPPQISQLQKLQVLMVRREPKIIFVGVSFLPDEIWDMPQLRHLWFTETDFPALPNQVAENRVVLLLNLQALSNVNAAFFTDDVLYNMPNLKKLSMWIESPAKIEFNLDTLSQLEFFKFVVLNPIPEAGKGIHIDPKRFFPKTLKRLNLSGCGLPWDNMKIVAKLPVLEVLKLREHAFYGNEWSLTYKLPKLKHLLIEYLNFIVWEANDTQFPILERLTLRHCYELVEIPQDFTYINTLEQIEVVDCSRNAVSSAAEIEQNLENMGKTTTQVRIFSSWE